MSAVLNNRNSGRPQEVISMGMGVIGQPNMVFKRKFRWVFVIQLNTERNTMVPASFVKLAARPRLEIDDVEINFLNATQWIPGKGKWQPLSVSYHDVSDNSMKPLYDWIASIHDITDPDRLRSTEKLGWAATGLLTMYDSCGTPIEGWELRNLWPQSIDFGELNYEDSGVSTIDLVFRYSDAIHTSYCMDKTTPIFSGCGGRIVYNT